MKPTGCLEGRVVSNDGTPIAEARVFLAAGVERVESPAVSTTDGGHYFLAGLVPGSYTVLLSSNTHGDHSTRVQVRETVTTRLDFVLPA